jgi:PAS domain S-box-containing protein
MKTRFQGLSVMLVTALIITIAASVMGAPFWVPMSALSTTLVAALLLVVGWMRYVKKMLEQSNALLSKSQRVAVWSFKNSRRLQQNQDEIEKKFRVSAELIANLTHPEKIVVDNPADFNDPIGKALLLIKTEMQKIREDDDRRRWLTQGIADLGEVLRNKQEVQDYGNSILSFLVKYLGANQGKFFIAYEDDESGRYLELVACYAYDKRKYGDEKIFEGQGILGQNMLEKDFTFLAAVPDSYVKITSGLGEATPRSIVIAPLIINDTYCGALEIASFQRMEQHQIEFLKKVCENIASEIAALKTMRRTQGLLDESRGLAQALQHREEEMKRNLDELSATQAEMGRKQTELKSYLSAINNTIASAEFSLTGKLVDASEIFLKVLGYCTTDIAGLGSPFLMGDDAAVVMMWENLRLGKFFSGEFKMRHKSGRDLWLTGTFNPIFLEGDVPEKIMMFAQFTTQEKEKINDLNAMVNVIKSTLPVLEFNPEFACKTANDKAMKIFGLSRLELRSKNMRCGIGTKKKFCARMWLTSSFRFGHIPR